MRNKKTIIVRISFKQELVSLLPEDNQWMIGQRRKREEKTKKMRFHRFIITRNKKGDR